MEFDPFDSSEQFDAEPAKPQKRPSGKWFWPLTLLSAVLVGGLSFFMAWLTKDIQDRPVWMMGLIFMVPAGAMFFSAMLLEFSTCAMTPSLSRSSQLKVAVAATLATFLVACLCDGIYLFGGYAGDSSDNLIFLDYEEEITGNSATDQAVMKILDDLYVKSGTRVETSLFMFSFSNMDTDNNTVIPMKAFTKEHLEEMREALIEGKMKQGSSYGITYAYEMAENSTNGKPTRIIIICDTPIDYAEGSTIKDWERVVKRLKDSNITLFFMGNGETDEGIQYITENTGGTVISGYNADNVLENLRTLVRADGDMVRTDTTSARVLSGIMLILEGIVIGLGLMLLLSYHKQKRFQAIFSPIMAIAAFLLLKIVPRPENMGQWVLEGIAFSLFGLVFMTRNHAGGKRRDSIATRVDKDAENVAIADDEW
ncbi:MAG: hypothetical protein IKE15_09080 [Clostridia bacterium]|nr:hypothetical protein [Clostridia bacterium]